MQPKINKQIKSKKERKYKILHTHILGQYDCYTIHTHTHTHTQTHRETSASPIRGIGTKPTIQLVLFHSLSPTINYALGSGSASDPFF